MKKNILKMSLILVTATILLNACKKDKPGEGNDEEVITTLNLRFIPTSGTGSVVNFSYDDADGPGGAAPIQSVISLSAATTYNVEVTVLNKTVNPVDDITEEVIEEADAHRFYIEPNPSNLITVSNLNVDQNGIALGTSSRWTTGAAGTGTVKVTLRHYPSTPPNKAASDPVNSPKSDTDIEVTFAANVL